LKSLAVLDIDSLDYVPEIAECISSSSSSLKSLQLSFSDRLALKARKKMVVETSDTETLPDDDFDALNQSMPPPLPPPPLMGNPGSLFGPAAASTSNHADVRKERSAQEKVLAQIFGLDKASASEKLLEQAFEAAIAVADREARALARESLEHDEDMVFVKKLREITSEVSSKKSRRHSGSKHIRALEKIEKAACKYLERKENGESVVAKKSSASQKKAYVAGHSPTYAGSSLSQVFQTKGAIYHQKNAWEEPENEKPYPNDVQSLDLLSKSIKKGISAPLAKHQSSMITFALMKPTTKATPVWNGKEETVVNSGSGSDINDGPSESESANGNKNAPLNGAHQKPSDGLTDIVDMEHPDDEGDAGEDQEFIEDAESGNDTETQSSTSGVLLVQNGLNGQSGKPESSDPALRKGKEPIRELPNAVGSNESQETVPDEQAVHDYLRQNHGISLESLAIHLIPVKASVLCRSIDICSLKHISLLNVGVQRHFWSMLMKLQKTSPLKLTSIHSDNVTQPFLSFLNNLDDLTELFMIERNSRSKVESFASKTNITIEDIRKQVLKKHVRTLRRLMVRNDEDSGWTLNRKSVLLITKFGSNLVELMVGLNSANFHLFMQQLAGLRSLYALQVLFQHRDVCNSMLRELRLCIVDNAVHCPGLRVEYVALCLSVHGLAANSVTQLKRNIRKSHVPAYVDEQSDLYRRRRRSANKLSSSSTSSVGWDIKGKGKAKSSYHALEADLDQGESNFDEMPLWTPDESDEDDNYAAGNASIVDDGLRVSDIVGVKMWEKEIWELSI
jgi:hypothetical protein